MPTYTKARSPGPTHTSPEVLTPWGTLYGSAFTVQCTSSISPSPREGNAITASSSSRSPSAAAPPQARPALFFTSVLEREREARGKRSDKRGGEAPSPSVTFQGDQQPRSRPANSSGYLSAFSSRAVQTNFEEEHHQVASPYEAALQEMNFSTLNLRLPASRLAAPAPSESKESILSRRRHVFKTYTRLLSPPDKGSRRGTLKAPRQVTSAVSRSTSTSLLSSHHSRPVTLAHHSYAKRSSDTAAASPLPPSPPVDNCFHCCCCSALHRGPHHAAVSLESCAPQSEWKCTGSSEALQQHWDMNSDTTLHRIRTALSHKPRPLNFMTSRHSFAAADDDFYSAGRDCRPFAASST